MFIEGIKTSLSGLTAEANGATYLAWATALALAGRPQQQVVTFGGHPFLPLLGGAVVAVDAPLPNGALQRTWLPILNPKNEPITLEHLTARDVSDSINRCRAKSAAMVNGVGLALYAGYGENVAKFLKELGVRPNSDLATVEPLVSTKGKVPYVDWTAALSAARITDENFHWEVVMFSLVEQETGELVDVPYCRMPFGYMVAVKVTYKGTSHTEYLPIMGVVDVETRQGKRKMDNQPLLQPTSWDWNRAVMRALTKAIAVVSGYGLNVYAKEDLEALQARPIGSKAQATSEAAAQADQASPNEAADAADQESAAPATDEAAPSAHDAADDAAADAIRQQRQQMIADIEAALASSGKTVAALVKWLGEPPETELAALSDAQLRKAHQAVQAMRHKAA